jgi:cold shock CspA family protein
MLRLFAAGILIRPLLKNQPNTSGAMIRLRSERKSMMDAVELKKLQTIDEGTVKSYDNVAGKGLIARKENDDVHVNRAALKHVDEQTLQAGDRLRFQVVKGPKGLFASAVLKIRVDN